MLDTLKKCQLCPRRCGANRFKSEGVCGANDKVKVAYYSLHQWEEPIISGTNGSGTIFFSHCNLKCIFCQNRKISSLGYGKEISNDRLKEIMLELQEKGAHNINLVTPTHYVLHICSALSTIKNNTLKIPVVYNTSSYENVKTLKLLNGLVDIYLADFKYYDNTLALNYSNAPNYFEIACNAIDEMYKQVGSPIVSDELLKSGMIVRILVLPGHVLDAKRIIKYLWERYGNNIFFSIMNQYTPIKNDYKYDNLNRTVTEEEYNEVLDYACKLGIERAFVQEENTALESFIPDFDCGVV